MIRISRISIVHFILAAAVLVGGCSNQDAASQFVTSKESVSTSTSNQTADLQNSIKEVKKNRMNIHIGDHVFTATLVDNSTTRVLKEMLSKGPVTIHMRDYENMEKVGMFDKDLPRNDESISTEPGDLILYQGRAFVIYYDSNSWNFTRIGKIDHATQKELKEALGSGDVTVTLSFGQKQ